MTFKVIDKRTGREADADAVAEELDQAGQLTVVIPHKNGWVVDEDGGLCIADACGHYQYVDRKRFEAVAE